MIGKLVGAFGGMSGSEALIMVAGVGYAVRTTFETSISLEKNPDRVELYIHTAVREDALDLYGFPTEDELSFFRLLLSVSGIGPKTALGILNLATVPVLRNAIAAGDTTYLTKVSGIGKKSAERIVVELRDRLAKEGHGKESHAGGDAEVLEALASLGYREVEARDALKKVSAETSGTSERLREALKILSS